MKLIITILLIFTLSPTFSQGAWNIGYIEIDSINKLHIGKIVKVDFANKEYMNSNARKRMIRNYTQAIDSCALRFDKHKITFIEKRIIYADHGSFEDQFIESNFNKQNKIIRL